MCSMGEMCYHFEKQGLCGNLILQPGVGVWANCSPVVSLFAHFVNPWVVDALLANADWKICCDVLNPLAMTSKFDGMIQKIIELQREQYFKKENINLIQAVTRKRKWLEYCKNKPNFKRPAQEWYDLLP